MRKVGASGKSKLQARIREVGIDQVMLERIALPRFLGREELRAASAPALCPFGRPGDSGSDAER